MAPPTRRSRAPVQQQQPESTSSARETPTRRRSTRNTTAATSSTTRRSHQTHRKTYESESEEEEEEDEEYDEDDTSPAAPKARQSSRTRKATSPVVKTEEEEEEDDDVDYDEEEEMKVPKDELLIGRMGPSEDEKFQFSFQDEGLTARECADKMDTFKTKEEFLETIHVDEALRFITKVLIGRKGRPLGCMICDRMYASAGGYWWHWSRCQQKTDNESSDDVARFREVPILWLKVAKRNQEEMLKKIVGEDYTCFSMGCNRGFRTAKALISHLDECVRVGYWTYKDRPDEFRKLDKKPKNALIREALASSNGTLACFLCAREYSHPHGLLYHIDRCQVEESVQPWKCYRCGHEALRSEAEAHLLECGRMAEMKVFDTKMEAAVLSLLNNHPTDTDATPTTSTPLKRRRTAGGAPRATARKDGTTLFRFRKSTVNREFNGVVTLADQRNYEEICQNSFDQWKIDSDCLEYCNRLQHIPIGRWTPQPLDKSSQFYRIFTRQSVTFTTQNVEGLQEHVPRGTRVMSRESAAVTDATCVGYCGAPINNIHVAPGKTLEGDDVICVTTFANETDFESEDTVVQFWTYKGGDVLPEGAPLKLWFLLHIPRHGTCLSMTWLQKHDTTELGLIGFVAFAMTTGKVLIYRIDSNNVLQDPLENSAGNLAETEVSVVVQEPHLILTLQKSPEGSSISSDDSFLNATIKVEGEEISLPIRIDESAVPILKISWCGHSGGKILAGITGLGEIAIWNLDENLNIPKLYSDDEWQSPPTDIAFLNFDHVVVGFKERLVKVFNIDTWIVKLEDSTVKTAGTHVHTDSRVVHSFFTYQSDHNSFPYSNATSVSYINMDMNSMNLILIPTGNMHQLMVWNVAMCAPLGTLLSCGVDGRLVASASGRLLKNIHHPFFANRNLMSLKRRRVMKTVQTMEHFLKEPKEEGAPSTSTATPSSSKENPKTELEESLVTHEDVCQKMWLEIGFDEIFEPTRVQLSCRDQRIESLNCVDATTNATSPMCFTGGEAGLLFATPCNLMVKEMEL